MSADNLTVNEIASYWAEKILKGDSAIKIESLSKVEMPAALKSSLLTQGKRKIEEEIHRILDSPFLDLSKKAESEGNLRNTLEKIVSQRMVLPRDYLIRMVSDVYAHLLKEWEVDPISIRQASTNPKGLAQNLFARASAISALKNGDEVYSTGIIAQICNASGLGTLALTVQLESKLGVSSVNLSDLTTIIHRLILLKEHYQVGHNLESFEGTSRFLASDKTEPVLPEVSSTEDAKIDEPKSHRVVASPIADVKVDSTVPLTVKPVLEPPDLSKINPFLSPELTTSFKKGSASGEIDLGIHSEVIPPEPPSAPDDLDEQGLFMFALLMHPLKRAYLGNKLFDDDFHAYDLMIIKICHQKSIQHAVTLADNELYIHDISVGSIPAAELMRTIKTYFGKTEFNG